MPRCRGTVAEGATNQSPLHGSALQDVGGQFRKGQGHSAQSHGINHACSHGMLGDMRQPLLQIRISRSDKNAIRMRLLPFRRDMNLSRDTDQGTFGR